MIQEEFNIKNKKGEVEIIQPEVDNLSKDPNSSTDPMADYLNILQAIRVVKRHRTTPPTNTPKTYLQAIEFYDDGANRRVYFYINKVWRYVTLT